VVSEGRSSLSEGKRGRQVEQEFGGASCHHAGCIRSVLEGAV